MLRSLFISNYAIIDELEIRFSDKLTIITGETGAGKSILLGALALILGKRADSSVLYNHNNKCVVEGNFDLHAYSLQSFFEKEDLDYEPVTIIRREINAKGKSRAFINDTPVTLTVLRSLGNQLIDVHAQHETLELMEDIFQMNVIDSIAGNKKLKKEFTDKYRGVQHFEKELAILKSKNAQASKEQDYISFQLKEIDDAQLSDPQEQDELEEELNTLTNAEEIKASLLQAVQLLKDGEINIAALLNELGQALQNAARHHPGIEMLAGRVNSSRIELDDIGQELENVAAETIYDQGRITEIEDRLSMIYKLEKKHQVQNIGELIEIREGLRQQIADISGVEEKITALEGQLTAARKEMTTTGNQLAAQREKAIPGFEEEVNNLLDEVGMANARLKVEQSMLEEGNISMHGLDRIQFLFSANLGANFLDVSKVASGGELSRLMLIIKSLVAGSMALPSLIFDEIDAGVSGEVGLKVGKILERLSSKHQVVCITHLPQIASKGSEHYFVYKEIIQGRTITRVKVLDPEGRVQEIAKMLSGDKPTSAALENAKELLMN